MGHQDRWQDVSVFETGDVITKRAIVRPKLPQNIKSNMLPPDAVLSEALSHFIFPSDVYFVRPKPPSL